MDKRGARRVHLAVAGVASIALLLCLLLGWHAPRQALLSYLVAGMFCLSLSLGSMALLMVHVLTGGGWGWYLRPQLLAAMRPLPWLAVLWLPLLLGMRLLYPWAVPGAMADAALRRQAWYLDEGFFIVRMLVCFGVWLWLASALRRRLDRTDDTDLSRFAALGLIVYLLTVTTAAVDWVMSLVPAWRSSVFGLIVATSQLLGAAALGVGYAAFQHRRDDTPAHPPAEPARLLGDVGKLLLTLVLAWSYLAFMDYLTAWIGDLPAETVWYLPRLKTSWSALAAVLVVFHLAVPFAVLLSRQAKHHADWLLAVAALLLVMHYAYLLWLVVPSFRAAGFALAWTDPLAWLGIGGWWWLLFDARWRAVVQPVNASAARTLP
ncbi:hypothetical protein [Rhodanobacter caeni]